MIKKFFKKGIILVFGFLLVSQVFCSCVKKEMKLFKNASEIIVPKPQTDGQSLSIVVKNDKGELIIFDGGRVEDADYLYDIIKENGGKVAGWYLTHIHDDHIGALYKILVDKRDKIFDGEIKINNIYYHFADFDFYYEKMGADAGALKVFTDVLDSYKDFIMIKDDITKGETFDFYNVQVKVMNNLYKLDQDPINNTSIVYKVKIDNVGMMILGDLGYEGGEKLILEDTFSDIMSDIVVMSHHGQNGVSNKVYFCIMPKIAIWPTTKEIYENKEGKYSTDDTKEWLSDINVKRHILSYEGTTIIK